MKHTELVENIEQIEDSYGHIHSITGELSRGGQGAVLKTRDDQILIKVALEKNAVVMDDSENDEYDKLRILPLPRGICVTMPLATLKGVQGYLMRMLEGMTPFSDYFDKSFEAGTQRSTAWIDNICPESRRYYVDYYSSGGERKRLAAFLKSGLLLAELHASGLVYCDYSGNNVFISKNSDFNNVWLIDSDNLNTEARSKKGLVFTPGIAPPELMRYLEEMNFGDSIPAEERWGCGNTFASDSFTYAVCLFKQLTLLHPYEGKLYNSDLADCVDRTEIDARRDRCEYPYIYDENDDSNYAEFFPYDFVLTEELKKLFQQTFDELGKYYKWNRPTMYEWVNAVARAYDKCMRCPECGMDYVYSEDKGRICPWCDAKPYGILKLFSHYLENDEPGNIIWEYVHEISAIDSLDIPLRMLNGLVSEDVERSLVTIKTNNGQNTICLADNGLALNMMFSNDGCNYNKANRVNFDNDVFYVKFFDTDGKSLCLLRGEIFK